ncbi:MAG: PepSY domain-containing protein [Clostridia bacterium]|nr:PepSY domain-containing protein [Clostridia bacterium]
MHRLISLILLLSMIIVILPACEKEPQLITEKTAKETITEIYPEAIILECLFVEEERSYIVDFKTFHGTYEGIVNASSGKLLSVMLKEPETDEPMFAPEDEESASEEVFISLDTALTLALRDSGASGTAVLVKNSLDRENKTYNIIFRSGNTEYNYLIDAVTGDILSSDVVIDS